MMDIVFFATAWGPVHGGINAFNHDLALAVAKELPKPGRVFCAVLRPDPLRVQDAARGNVILISIERDPGSDRMDPDWVNSVQKEFGKHGGVPQEACWVGHDVISGELAMEAQQSFGGRCALIHHMSYGAYASVKAFEGDEANRKLREQEALFGAAQDCALFGVGPYLQRSCRELAGREAVLLIPGFPEARANTSTDEALRAITFGRLGSADDRIKLGLLAARGFSYALDDNAKQPNPNRCLSEASMFALGLSGDSKEEAEFRAMAVAPSGRAANITRLAYSSRQEIFDRLRKSNLCLMLSWHEGFGLTSWEALAHEVPLVVSRYSGAYELMEKTLGSVEVRGLVEALDIQGSTPDPNNLSEADTRAVERVIKLVGGDLPARKAAAKKLKALLQEKLGCTWKGTAEAFLAALGANPSSATASRGPSASSASATVTNTHPTPTVRRAGLWAGHDAELAELVPLLLSQRGMLLNRPEPAGWAAFAAFLKRHMEQGTAGAAKPSGLRWTQAELAEATSLREDGKTTVKRESISAYLNQRDLPEDVNFQALARALFGDKPEHAAERQRFTALWRAARRERDGARAAPSASPAPPPSSPDILPPLRCFGRDSELSALLAALLSTGSATALVMGDGGMGKTTLTRQAATHPDIIARFGPRRFEAALDTARSAADMQAALARAVGAEPAQGMEGIRARLATAPALLLLDNLETPWEAEGEAVEALLRGLAATPGLALIASIRGGESPRAPAWRHRCRLRPLPLKEARRVFLDIAHRIRAADPHLEPLLAELGGIPLAVELMAWQAEPEEDLSAIWAAWQKTGAVEDPRGGDHRHASLARSIEFSLASPRLGEAGRRVFRLLGALPAGLSRVDQDALLGAEASAGARQVLALGLGTAREGRLDLLPPIRRHAAAHHPPEGADALGWARHFLDLVAGLEDRMLSAGGEAMSRLAPEMANLEAAFMRGAQEAALRGAALGALWTYALICRFTGQGGAALRPLAAACAAAEDRLGEANCIQSLADIALARSDHAAARSGYEEALPIYRAVGSRLGEANCIQSLADIALRRSDHAAARSGYVEALPIYRAVGSRLGEANCIRSLADIALERSDHAAARSGYEEALPIYRAVGDRLGEANCIRSLAQIALSRSDHAAARSGYEEALPIYRAVGSRLGEANCILRLAEIALARSDHAAARSGYEEALSIYRAVGDRLGEANCIQSLADIALARSDHAAARSGYEEALPIYRAMGSRLGEANCIQSLADIALARSDHAAARSGYEEALPIYRAVGDVVGEALTLGSLGELAAAEGDREVARRLLLQAIAMLEGVGSAGNVHWARGVMDRLGLEPPPAAPD
jgi:tetratricopeptide (TPR) repeat protein/glycosyltransferase involved in cell wall biosynthesis